MFFLEKSFYFCIRIKLHITKNKYQKTLPEMIEQNECVTMEQVAQMAKVSIGTVDRVLHNRKGVSEKTRRKVFDVIEEIGYKTNIYASILSRKKGYCIVVVIPYFQPGSYWELVYNGITRAASEAREFNIDVKIFYYNQFDIDSYKAACRNMTDSAPDAICIAPIYKEATMKFLNELSSLSLPITYIDTRLEDTEYLAYYGMPMFESGYLAADLLVGEDKTINKVVSFNIDGRENSPNDSFAKRQMGFRKYLKDHNPSCKLYNCGISPTDFLNNIKIFDSFFKEHPDVNHIVTFNSRAHLIADWLELRDVSGKKLIGYDMLNANMSALKKNRITTLIAERTDNEAHTAVMTLVNYLVLNQKPAVKDNFSSLDILTRYNVDFYLSRQ